MTSTSRVLCVAGAVSHDYLLYPTPTPMVSPEHHTGPDAARHASGPSQMVLRTGSAVLIAELLAAAAPQWNFEVKGPALQQPSARELRHNATSVVDLARRPSPQEDHALGPGFDVVSIREIGNSPLWHSPNLDRSATPAINAVVITGSGESFTDVEPALDFLQGANPRYIIHHMTRPLATGRLWDIIRNGPMVREGLPDPDHLAVILDADDLRAEGISLSRGLSWEATVEDFVRNLGSNGRLDTLVTCPNLVVRLGNEGLIHHRGRDAVDPKLYFHPRKMESVECHMIGLASAFTAGFSVGFPEVDSGIKLGLAAARQLARNGFEANPQNQSPEYPVDAVMGSTWTAETRFASVSIPSARISSGDRFSIFECLTGEPAEVARQIVTDGPDRALARCPVRRFGKLQSFERNEQESLGATVETIQERLQAHAATPTGVGVMGPRGSGKKFVAENLAAHLGTKSSIKRLTYDALTMRPEHFTDICHDIRDNAADNFLTVACFENFEWLLQSENQLLDRILAVTRHGRFQDNGHQRSLGKCILIFLVNQVPPKLESTPTPTASNFDVRRPAVDDSALLEDLHSIIHLSGPNPSGPTDRLFPVRRALMLRQLLTQTHPHLATDGHIRIDDAVLHALLLVPFYKHGLHSLDKIVSTSRLAHRTKFDISALPPEELLQLHVDAPAFMHSLRSPKLPPVLRERLAEGMFEVYKTQRRHMARTDADRAGLARDRAMVDWDELPGELKESTRAQADDIPRKLRAVGAFMLNEERSEPLVRIPAFSTPDLDMLSEMEHERFNAERLQRQWRMGPRDSKQRTTPFLVPWRDLTQEWKDVDRVMVECVPRVLAGAGYFIYRMRDGDVGRREGRRGVEGREVNAAMS